MRICHIIPRLTAGGAENHLRFLASAQANMGHKVTIIALFGKDFGIEETIHPQVNLIDLSGRNFLWRIIKINQIVRRLRFNIINTHLPFSEIHLALFVNIEDSLLITTRHVGGNYSHRWERNYFKPLSQFILSRMDGIIAISKVVSESLVNVEKVDPKKVVVVPYGIPKDIWQMKVAARNKNVIKEFRFICVARIEAQKRISDLLKSFSIVKKEIPQASLYIFGEGTQRKRFLNLITDLGLADSIFLPGKVDNVFQELQEAHVFVLASEYEGFGLVYLEAILMNLPIISSNNDAALEVLGEGNFLGFNVGDVSALASNMIRINQEWGVIDSALKKNYSKIINKFSIEAMYEGTNLAYRGFSK